MEAAASQAIHFFNINLSKKIGIQNTSVVYKIIPLLAKAVKSPKDPVATYSGCAVLSRCRRCHRAPGVVSGPQQVLRPRSAVLYRAPLCPYLSFFRGDPTSTKKQAALC